MNNEILNVIEEREVLGFDFKIYGDFDNPLFLAKDVTTWIGHSNTSKMLKTIDEEEKVRKICDVTNSYSTSKARNTQEMLFLTEDGLYEVLMQSRKPIAKEFKKQVKMILKELRKGNIQLTPTISKKDLAVLDIIHSTTDIEQALAIKKFEELVTFPLLETIEEQKPKVKVYDNFVDKEHTLGFRELRKELESTLDITINENRFKDVMREYNLIGKRVKATAFAIRNGFAVTKDIDLVNGGTTTQDRFTMKTRDLLLERYRNN